MTVRERSGGPSRLRLLVALLVALAGAVWLGQGLGLIGDSAMSGSSFWALAGLALIVAAAAIGWTGRRSR